MIHHEKHGTKLFHYLFIFTRGTQESVTFYQTNGSQIDLGGIPKPLLTNVTAQSMVGVAPVGNVTSGIWDTSLSQLAALPAKPMAQSKCWNSI